MAPAGAAGAPSVALVMVDTHPPDFFAWSRAGCAASIENLELTKERAARRRTRAYTFTFVGHPQRR